MNTTNSLSNTSLLYNRGGYSIKNDSVAISANRFQMLKSALIKLMLVVGMVVGLVGVIDAQTQTLTFSLTSNPGGWPTTNSTTLTNYTYTLNGTNYTFALKNVKQNSGYLMLTSTAVLGLPAIPGYKLTKVVASNSGTCSTSTKVGISSSSSSETYIDGGAKQTWNTQSSSYTYNLTGTYANTMYYLYVTNKNAQITQLELTYSIVSSPSYTVTFNAGTGDCTTNSLTGSSITLPVATAPIDCSSYSFYGWATAAENETSVAPRIVGTAGQTYNPANNITLYAVYSTDISYQKVTSNLFDWSGAYLIICESESVAFDGSLETLDVANNNIPVTISSNTIESTPTTNASAFVIAKNIDDYTIKSVSGYYIGRTANSNGLESSTSTQYSNAISYSESSISIISSGSRSLQFNSNSDQKRFRYFGPGQKEIQLYRQTGVFNSRPNCTVATVTYDGNGATEGSVPEDNTAYPIGATVTVLGNTGNLAKYGYSFDGWNTAADGSGVSYSAGTTFTITENTTLYAQWTPNDYYVTWWANGLALEGMDYTYGDYIPEGDIYDEDAENYACEGKHFVGWSVTEFEETDDFPAMTTRDQIASTPVSGEKIYYAVFANVDANNAPLNTILWSETWSGGSAGDNPSDYVFSGTNVYGGATLTYAQSDDNTKLYSEYLAGGASPELLLSKSNKTWTISDIPTGGAKEMSFTFKSNKIDFELTTTTENIDISGSETSWIITAAENVTNFNLTLKNTGSNNARIDDIELKVTKIYATGYTTFCPCAYEIDGISNGDMVWAGKNGPTNEWNLASNWVVYRSSDSKYHLTNEAPTSGNVFIKRVNDGGGCIINVKPHLTSDVTCNNIKLDGLGIDIAENQTLTINGTATFTNGVINGNVTFGSSATVSGASASSHVDGVVTKSGAANGFTFPTGSNGNLGKVEVTDGSATNVSVQYFSNPAGFGTNDLPRWWNAADMSGENPFNHVSNVEYWKISSNEAITANFVAEASTDMHFNSETAEEDRIPANIQMAFYDNNRWTNVGGSASIDGNTLTITGAEIPASATRGISGNYTTFGSKSKSTVLPIELVSFTANCNGRSALIEWTTATEKNNDFFVLERSHDAVNFKEIARIAGAGNSIEPISYAYTDFGVRNGDNYYRLVQVDYDGTSTASEIIVANCLGTDGEPEVLAYPNPFGDDLTLRFENFGNIQATVEVYDMLGRMVHTQKVNCSQNDYEVVLRLAGLSDGTYNVRISAKEFVLNKKVVKQ